VASIFKRLDDPKAEHFAGVDFPRSWGDIEKPDGSLDLQIVLDLCDGCAQRGKGFILTFEHKSFNTPLADDMPGRAAPLDVEVVAHKISQPAAMAAIFKRGPLARLCWVVSRLADALDGRPGFLGIDTSETAPGPDLSDDEKAALDPALRHYYRAVARAFRSARPFANINFLGGAESATALRDYVHTLGFGLSCADMIPTEVNASRPSGMPFLAAMSMLAVQSSVKYPLASMASAWKLARERKADAVWWTDWMKAPNDWERVLAFTARPENRL
jgi:hypothetical protein